MLGFSSYTKTSFRILIKERIRSFIYANAYDKIPLLVGSIKSDISTKKKKLDKFGWVNAFKNELLTYETYDLYIFAAFSLKYLNTVGEKMTKAQKKAAGEKILEELFFETFVEVVDRTNKTGEATTTLEDIYDECEAVQGTPYGHNMIAIICNAVADRFGEDEADKIYNEYQI